MTEKLPCNAGTSHEITSYALYLLGSIGAVLFGAIAFSRCECQAARHEIVKGSSGLATPGGDHLQDLLPEPVAEFVSSLF